MDSIAYNYGDKLPLVIASYPLSYGYLRDLAIQKHLNFLTLEGKEREYFVENGLFM